ncbi:MAG: hypothetical protein LBS90_03625 [Oscillospiraceae bacterium]|jgi:hypothetical protein|nr:hypothetical protein [Oscillospiraceae bacterium]
MTDRPKFGDPAVAYTRGDLSFLNLDIRVPDFDKPVSPVENFYRAARRDKPLWLPNAVTDFQTLMTQDVVYTKPGDVQLHANFKDPRNKTENYEFYEWFGGSWTWVVSAGGAMLTPGCTVCSDIAEWETQITFPKLAGWDFESRAADFMRDEYDPNRVMHFDIGRGVTERLVSVTGGYTDGMLALAAEPDAVRAFFERYTDFLIELFDRIHSLYNLNLLTLHDDWGTERDTFFSERMMEDLVFAPTKRFIDYVHSKNCVFELHSCGNVGRFLPHMIDMGADLLQLQARANDIHALKAKYGDRIGFNVSPEIPAGAADGERERAVREFVGHYGRHGGAYASVFSFDERENFENIAELYFRSLEYYRQNGE